MSILKLSKPIAALISYLTYKKDRLRLEKLMSNGLSVGKNVYIMEDVEFDRLYPFLINIGDNCRISKGVRILAHDATTFRDLGINKIARVNILEGTFIGERAIILPGVTLGPRALITAGSVVNRDIGEDKVAAGNPARPYGKFSDLLNNNIEIAKEAEIINKKDIENGLLSSRELMHATEGNKIAYTRGAPKRDPYYINTEFEKISRDAESIYHQIIGKYKNKY